MTSKTFAESSFTLFEKHPAENESKSFNERLDVIQNDKNLSQEE